MKIIYFLFFKHCVIVKVKASVKSNPITCEVCKYAMSYLDSMLVKNSTEEDVKKALDSLCAKLPSSMSSEVNII